MGTIVHQRTLKHAIGCSGVGLHTGARAAMTLHPAEPDSGIRFKRTDIAGGQAVIAAEWGNVVDSQLCSAIANAEGVTIQTIEHLMAAFAGTGIDNALVEITGPEVPIMDGSAAPFVFLVECAGIVEQPAPRRALKVLKPVTVRNRGREVSVTPANRFSIGFDIDFAAPAVARQEYHFEFVDGAFKKEVARARTFGFEHEVANMRAAGMLRGGSLDNAVVVSNTGVLNDSGLRYADEFVRHKVLDCIGDLYLAGAPILGHVHASRSGHALNHKLLSALFTDAEAWALVPLRAGRPVDAEAEPAAFAAESPRAATAASL